MPWLNYNNKTLIQGKSYAEYYIVFLKAEVDIWFLPWVHKEISHCFAVKWDNYNWIGFYPSIGYSDVYVLPCYDSDIRIALAELEYTDIIQVKAWRKIHKWRALWPMPVSCVEQVKTLLGISAWWVLTPYQLYKYLGGSHGGNTKQTKDAS